MKVVWTETALAQLESIRAFISRDSVTYARRVVDRLTRRSEQIANYPLSGRAVPEVAIPQVREVIEGSYRIIYYINPRQIDILTVIHGAQRTPWSADLEGTDDEK